MRMTKTGFQWLAFLSLFLLITSLVVIKYDIYAAAREDHGKFHEGVITLIAGESRTDVRFHTPRDYYIALESARQGLRDRKAFRLGARIFEGRSLTGLQCRVDTHSENQNFDINVAWADQTEVCGCAERSRQTYPERLMAGLSALQKDFLDDRRGGPSGS